MILLVQSRIFHMRIGDTDTEGLVAFADMLNHSSVGKNTAYRFSPNRNGFEMKAVMPIARGEEVCGNYGRQCNSRFFLHYGFINQPNDANSAHICLKLKAAGADPLFEKKQAFLAKMGKADEKVFGFDLLADMNEPTNKQCLSMLRFIEYEECAELPSESLFT
jgi:protein-histidine N-methyltransferase